MWNKLNIQPRYANMLFKSKLNINSFLQIPFYYNLNKFIINRTKQIQTKTSGISLNYNIHVEWNMRKIFGLIIKWEVTTIYTFQNMKNWYNIIK